MIPKLCYRIITLFIAFSESVIFAGKSYTQESLKENITSLHGLHITSNFPDPCIVYDPTTDTLYTFATTNFKTHDPSRGPHINIQIASSKDRTTWKLHIDEDALPFSHLAPWQTGKRVWAPDVTCLSSGRWVLYYADALKTSPAFHCIGAATSDSITGPYTALPTPLICPHGGAIDPAGFIDKDSGKRYIVYKIDSNSLGNGGSCNNDVPPIQPTPIMLQEVDLDDGITLIDQPTKLLDRDALDGPLIEAPAMYKSHESIYFLFFSSNCFSTPLYDVSYATAINVTGPYTKAARPLLVTGDADLVGPGGLDVLDLTDLEGKQIEEHATVAFHGHMLNQRPKPLVRGMYTGTVHFKQHKAIFEV